MRSGFEPVAFAGKLVDYGQHPKLATCFQAIGHEVHPTISHCAWWPREPDHAEHFHEKAVKLFLKFISHSSRGGDRASIRTRYVGPCFDPEFARNWWNVAIWLSKSHIELPGAASQSFRIVRPQLGSRVPLNVARSLKRIFKATCSFCGFDNRSFIWVDCPRLSWIGHHRSKTQLLQKAAHPRTMRSGSERPCCGLPETALRQ